MTTRESALSRDRRLRAKRLDERQAARKGDPVAKAAAMTEGERKRIADAEVAVERAEAEVARIAFRKRDLERLTRRVDQPSVISATGFAKWVSAPRDAVAAAKAERELQGLPVDFQAARDVLQGRIRELRRVEAEVNAARRARRIAAEFAAQPKPPKPHLTGDPFSNVVRDRWGT